MAKVFIEESTLTSIGDAIREKTGGSELIAPLDMATQISSITTGGGEVEPIVLTGDCSYGCAGSLAGGYIDLFGDSVTTENITKADYTFYYNSAENIPFELNFKQGSTISCQHMFDYSKLTAIPKFNNCKINTTTWMFANMSYIKEYPEDMNTWFDWSNLDSSSGYGQFYALFQRNYSLRKAPVDFIAHGRKGSLTSPYYCGYGATFTNCYALDELVNIPIIHPEEVSITSNVFENFVSYCHRLKNMTFKLQEDGSPYVVKWKSQTIDLSNMVGYASYSSQITGYNSGITADKEVKNDTKYQALKTDVDWFTCDIAYSRYNHDSAVATINSLPDTSAYLATAGGTNTIKFRGAAGSATDGGAINTLTEEEIAVATAKGWTVSLA